MVKKQQSFADKASKKSKKELTYVKYVKSVPSEKKGFWRFNETTISLHKGENLDAALKRMDDEANLADITMPTEDSEVADVSVDGKTDPESKATEDFDILEEIAQEKEESKPEEQISKEPEEDTTVEETQAEDGKKETAEEPTEDTSEAESTDGESVKDNEIELTSVEESKEESIQEKSLDEETTQDENVEKEVTGEPSKDETEAIAESEQLEQKSE